MKQTKKILAVLLVLAIALSGLVITASAEGIVDSNSNALTPSSELYVIDTSGSYTASGSIDKGICITAKGVTLTLDNANIVGDFWGLAVISSDYDFTLNLVGSSSLTPKTTSCKAIEVTGGSNTLTITGNGKVEVTSGEGTTEISTGDIVAKAINANVVIGGKAILDVFAKAASGGNNNFSYGIHGNLTTNDAAQVNVTAGDVSGPGENISYGIYGDVTTNGSSQLTVTGGDSVSSNYDYTYSYGICGDVTTNDSSQITATAGEAQVNSNENGISYGIDGRDITTNGSSKIIARASDSDGMSVAISGDVLTSNGKSSVEAICDDASDHIFGMNCNLVIANDSAKITVATGNTTGDVNTGIDSDIRAYGNSVITATTGSANYNNRAIDGEVVAADNATVIATAGEGGHASCGIDNGQPDRRIEVSDNATITATGGDAGYISAGICYDIDSVILGASGAVTTTGTASVMSMAKAPIVAFPMASAVYPFVTVNGDHAKITSISGEYIGAPIPVGSYSPSYAYYLAGGVDSTVVGGGAYLSDGSAAVASDDGCYYMEGDAPATYLELRSENYSLVVPDPSLPDDNDDILVDVEDDTTDNTNKPAVDDTENPKTNSSSTAIYFSILALISVAVAYEAKKKLRR